MKTIAALIFAAASMHAAVITYSTGSVSGSNGGINYTFTGTSGSVDTLPDFGISTVPFGALDLTLSTDDPQPFNIPLTLTRNGVSETASLELSFLNLGGQYLLGQAHFKTSPVVNINFGSPGFGGLVADDPFVVLFTIQNVPEPSSFALLGISLATAALLSRRLRGRFV